MSCTGRGQSKDMYLGSTSTKPYERECSNVKSHLSFTNQPTNYIQFHTEEIKEHCTKHHFFGEKISREKKETEKISSYSVIKIQLVIPQMSLPCKMTQELKN